MATRLSTCCEISRPPGAFAESFVLKYENAVVVLCLVVLVAVVHRSGVTQWKDAVLLQSGVPSQKTFGVRSIAPGMPRMDGFSYVEA